jgi:hypothetical protein
MGSGLAKGFVILVGSRTGRRLSAGGLSEDIFYEAFLHLLATRSERETTRRLKSTVRLESVLKSITDRADETIFFDIWVVSKPTMSCSKGVPLLTSSPLHSFVEVSWLVESLLRNFLCVVLE